LPAASTFQTLSPAPSPDPAQAAGEWYYGTVTAKTVEETLEGAVKAGLLRLKK